MVVPSQSLQGYQLPSKNIQVSSIIWGAVACDNRLASTHFSLQMIYRLLAVCLCHWDSDAFLLGPCCYVPKHYDVAGYQRFQICA
jgi:hypothetical protein